VASESLYLHQRIPRTYGLQKRKDLYSILGYGERREKVQTRKMCVTNLIALPKKKTSKPLGAFDIQEAQAKPPISLKGLSSSHFNLLGQILPQSHGHRMIPQSILAELDAAGIN
jgi:hypothetical protein